MGSDYRTLTLALGEVPPEQWRFSLVFSRDYQPEAREYKGKCTHEDVAFLVDPLKIIGGDWEKWAREELHTELEAQYQPQGQTLMRLRIYVSLEPILHGTIKYPAVRVESWHHGSPAVEVVLALVIGLVILVWLFIDWLFKKAEEIDWGKGLGALGWLAVVLFGLAVVSRKKEKKKT